MKPVAGDPMTQDEKPRPFRSAARMTPSDVAPKSTRDQLAEPIGYKKPPVTTRFQKGQSGNPAGRPKGSSKSKPRVLPLSPTLDELRRRHVETLVKIRDGDGVREVHVIEALQRQIDKLAFAGGIQAARTALARAEQTMQTIEAEYQANRDLAERYRVNYERFVQRFAAKGELVPDSIARPEDVHCSREQGFRIIGPCDEAGLERYLTFKRWRDALHIKMIYDERVFFHRPGARARFTLAEFFVFTIDHALPTRWRLDSQEMQDRTFELICSPRQRLERRLSEAFEAVGLRPPLKKPMPPAPDKLLRFFGMNPREIRKRFRSVG